MFGAVDGLSIYVFIKIDGSLLISTGAWLSLDKIVTGSSFLCSCFLQFYSYLFSEVIC